MKELMILFSLFLLAQSCFAMEQNKESKKDNAVISFQNSFTNNHNMGLAWCATGILNALVSSKLINMYQSLPGSSYRKLTKKFLIFTVVSTIISIGAMLKYANNNKKLLEDTQF